MNIERITYHKTFNLGNYSSEKIGVDIVLNAGEDAMAALDAARKLVEEYHEKNNPSIYQTQFPEIPLYKPPANIPSPEPPKEEKFDLIREINSCKSLAVLKIYEKQTKTDEEKQAYIDQFEKLKPKQ